MCMTVYVAFVLSDMSLHVSTIQDFISTTHTFMYCIAGKFRWCKFFMETHPDSSEETFAVFIFAEWGML